MSSNQPFVLQADRKLPEHVFNSLLPYLEDILRDSSFTIRVSNLSKEHQKKLEAFGIFFGEDFKFTKEEIIPAPIIQQNIMESTFSSKLLDTISEVEEEKNDKVLKSGTLIPTSQYSQLPDLDISIINHNHQNASHNNFIYQSDVNVLLDPPKTYHYTFEKTDDMIALLTHEYTSDKILSFAKKNVIELVYHLNSIEAKHQDPKKCEDCIKNIQQVHSYVLLFNELEGEDSRKISCFIEVIMNNREAIKKILSIDHIGYVKSSQFIAKLAILSKNSPELDDYMRQNKFNEDLKKNTFIKFMLSRNGAKNDPNLKKKFEVEFLDKILSFELHISFQRKQILSSILIKQVQELCKNDKIIFCSHSHSTEIDKSHKLISKETFSLKLFFLRDAQTNLDSKKLELSDFAKKFGSEAKKILFPNKKVTFDAQNYEIYIKLLRDRMSLVANQFSVQLEEIDKTSLSIQGDLAEKFYEVFLQETKKVKTNDLLKMFKPNQNPNLIIQALYHKSNLDFWTETFAKAYEELDDLVIRLTPNMNTSSISLKIFYLEENTEILKKADSYFAKWAETLQGFEKKIKLETLLQKSDLKSEKEFKKENQVAILPNEKTGTIIFAGIKENVLECLDNIDKFLQDSKPDKFYRQFDSLLIFNNMKKNKELGLKCHYKWMQRSVLLTGPKEKVTDAKEKINEWEEALKMQIIRPEMPSTNQNINFLKICRKKLIPDLSRKHECYIHLKKPSSSPQEYLLEITNQTKDKFFYLIKGDITKLSCQAIVNSTDLAFVCGGEIQGVAKSILDKAGNKFLEECKNFYEDKEQLLNPGEIFISGPGDLTNCDAIYNVCPLAYTTDQDLPKNIESLKKLLIKILLNAISKKQTSIAIPFLSSGSYGMPLQECMKAMVESCFNMLFSKSALKSIFFVEVDENKVLAAREKILELIGEKSEVDELKYDFKWKDDTGFKDYTLEINRKLNKAILAGENSIDIDMPFSQSPGTHKLKNLTATHITLRKVYKLKKLIKNWYLEDIDLGVPASEFIDSKFKKSELEFEIFLNCYKVDFIKKIQTNRLTSYEREIRILPRQNNSNNMIQMMNSSNSMNSSQILNTSGTFKIKLDELVINSQRGKYNSGSEAKIVVETFDQKNADKVFAILKQEIEKNRSEMTLNIPKTSDPKILELLMENIEKEELEIKSGKLISGGTIRLKGLTRCLEKFKSILDIIMVAHNNDEIPDTWKEQEKNCELIQLSPNDEEYQEVLDDFNSTLGKESRIVKIWRIQNKKLYKDHLREIKDLEKLHQTHGLSEKINRMLLWHGTSNNDPKLIYENEIESFQIIYSAQGLWGKGLYFAANASYSKDYAYCPQTKQMSTFQKGTTNLMMLVDVIIGDSITMKPDKNIVQIPERNHMLGENLLYESIRGRTQEGDIYILKTARRAYPKYLVEFA